MTKNVKKTRNKNGAKMKIKSRFLLYNLIVVKHYIIFEVFNCVPIEVIPSFNN